MPALLSHCQPGARQSQPRQHPARRRARAPRACPKHPRPRRRARCRTPSPGLPAAALQRPRRRAAARGGASPLRPAQPTRARRPHSTPRPAQRSQGCHARPAATSPCRAGRARSPCAGRASARSQRRQGMSHTAGPMPWCRNQSRARPRGGSRTRRTRCGNGGIAARAAPRRRRSPCRGRSRRPHSGACAPAPAAGDHKRRNGGPQPGSAGPPCLGSARGPEGSVTPGRSP
mmetsp:Transcript_34091/g.106062  ORF Transcript_34091/g.106062 Transcript_34091/m.106062 type:complete len:231 (-) Transcript_34091:546-1238(-)